MMDVVEVVFIFVVIIVVVDVAIEVVVVTVDVDSATVTEKTTLESVDCSVLLEVRTSELVEEDADEAVDAVMGEVEVIFLFGPELEDITVIVVVVVVVVGVTVGVVVAVVVVGIVVIIVVVLDVVVNSVTCSSDTGSEKEFIMPGSLLHKD